jgi:hypothetical protein
MANMAFEQKIKSGVTTLKNKGKVDFSLDRACENCYILNRRHQAANIAAMAFLMLRFVKKIT